MRGLACAALALVGWWAGAATAQPQVVFEFHSMFGEQRRYIDCLPEDRHSNGLCSKPLNYLPPDGLFWPSGVDWTEDRHLYIADQFNNKLQFCTEDGGECRWIGLDGSGINRNFAGTFTWPHGVEIGPGGIIAVADEYNHAAQVYEPGGAVHYSGDDATFDNEPECSLGKYDQPKDVAFDSLGRIYVVDRCDRIKRLRLDGGLTVDSQYTGTEGDAPGQFRDPGGIAIDAEDRIIIADTGNHRIQVCRQGPGLDLTRLACTAFGARGSAPGQFESPVGVDVDTQGRIWIADTLNHRVQACDYQGECAAFGGFADIIGDADEAGEGWQDSVDWSASPGGFNHPHDIAWHPSGRVAVVDTRNSRIQVFLTTAAFEINAGLNDAWYEPRTAGQGFLITVFPDLQRLFMAQFTFDVATAPAGPPAHFGGDRQRWLTAFGGYTGAVAELEAELSSGGIFDQAAPAARITPGYGSYTLEFHDCHRATLRYAFPDQGLAGEIPLERVVPENAALCQVLTAPP